ncbi:MAG: hypothetical protein PHY94_00590 [Candidatus Omnitrophica bacterium]|nr:hypothetical protein [Candidatus Omnitrophota bacterium]
MSRRSRRNRYKKNEPQKITETVQESLPAPAAPITEDRSFIVGPKKFKEENYRSEHTILFYSLLAFGFFVLVAVIVMLLLHKIVIEKSLG